MYVSKKRSSYGANLFSSSLQFARPEVLKVILIKSFGILCSYLSTKKGLSRDSFEKKEVVSNYWTFSIKKLKNWDKRVLWTLFKPEFRVIKFQRCSICPSIHCIHQIIRDPANFVTSYIVVKYSCIAQIVFHLFWPMKCTFLFEFLNLAQLCCCRTLRY